MLFSWAKAVHRMTDGKKESYEDHQVQHTKLDCYLNDRLEESVRGTRPRKAAILLNIKMEDS
jgi:hypothetical protein